MTSLFLIGPASAPTVGRSRLLSIASKEQRRRQVTAACRRHRAIAAEDSFRRLVDFRYLAKVIAGVRFVDGVENSRDQQLHKVAA